jgi:dCMP deaminase
MSDFHGGKNGSSHEDLLREAYRVAQRSKDNSTQNGAILYDSVTDRVVASGFNDLHWEFADLPERRARPLKYQWTEHAERAAIYDAARNGIPTLGLWLYCPWLACADCGRAIVYAGIAKVISHDICEHYQRHDWKASIEVADQMFKEAAIEVVRVQKKLDVSFRFNGEVIEV